ncbi:GNAT family N-acetyltransferase [Phenylobacterium sp.]|uniref:GNAT family N-acetyltransferase n=1 Tax=Phenylobacterium sp. TaxID=1871053 RepID=UPI003982EF13
MSGRPILETDRLALREATESDAPFVLELLNERGFIENIADRGVRTLGQARAYIAERIVGSYEANGFGMWLTWEKDTGQPVGLAGLVRREGLDDPDIGYAFVERAWGRGLAQEAAAAVLRHACGTLGIEKLTAITTPENRASMAVLEKIGMKFARMIQLPGIEGESTYFTT